MIVAAQKRALCHARMWLKLAGRLQCQLVGLQARGRSDDGCIAWSWEQDAWNHYSGLVALGRQDHASKGGGE